jgi:hypothetical protein
VAGIGQQLTQQGDRAAQMIARGQFRHHATVHGVQRHLAVQGVAEQAVPAVVKAKAGLVAGGFYAQDQHRGTKLFERGSKYGRAERLKGAFIRGACAGRI